jgi:hypothetical protein
LKAETASKPAASHLVLHSFGTASREDTDVARLASLWHACSEARTLRERLDSVALRDWIRVADERPPLPEGDDPVELDLYPPCFAVSTWFFGFKSCHPISMRV